MHTRNYPYYPPFGGHTTGGVEDPLYVEEQQQLEQMMGSFSCKGDTPSWSRRPPPLVEEVPQVEKKVLTSYG
jgi:hypothetical protein